VARFGESGLEVLNATDAAAPSPGSRRIRSVVADQGQVDDLLESLGF